MGKKPVFERERAGPLEIIGRALLAKSAEQRAIFTKARLRGVAEAKERLDASFGLSGLETRPEIVGRHRVFARIARRASKRTIIAAISAEVREWKKDLWRKGQRPPIKDVAPLTGDLAELGEEFERKIGEREGVVAAGWDARTDPPERRQKIGVEAHNNPIWRV